MAIHSPFFDIFPKIHYDVKRDADSRPEIVPNIFFRFGYLKNILSQASAYDKYKLDDGDTPEALAEKLYEDSGAGWMIIYANKMFDPQFDWPLSSDEFEAYIIGKYGSVEKAQTSINHIQKTTTRENLTTGESFVDTKIVSLKRYTNNLPNVPFEYWAWNQTPSLVQGENNGTFNVTADTAKKSADNLEFDVTADIDTDLVDGGLATRSFVREYSIDSDIFREYSEGKAVSVYDHEFEMNEERKFIKVIKKQYYNKIMFQFKTMVGDSSTVAIKRF